MKISVTDACRLAGVTPATIIKWCTDFNIGVKMAGRWKIDQDKLNKIIAGEINYPKPSKGKK